MLRVLGRKTSGNVMKLLWALEELGLAYEREDYGRQFDNTATPDYLALNPNGKVPTLVDGDLAIWESNTILRYLATRAGDTGLYPTDPAERSQVERWMDWQLASMNPPFMAVFRGARLPPAERAADYAPGEKEFGELMQLLDREMADRPFVALPRLTLADIAVAPTINRWFAWDVRRPDVPNLAAWHARVRERPGFRHVTV